MSEYEKALAFNRETKAALELVYNELNQGQQKKLMKNPEVKALFQKYGIAEDET